MKLWKCVQPDETISIGELYKRYYGETASPFGYDLFFKWTVQNCTKLTIISCTRSEPYRVTRKTTFFEKYLTNSNSCSIMYYSKRKGE